jgi:hypothetical protein
LLATRSRAKLLNSAGHHIMMIEDLQRQQEELRKRIELVRSYL